MTIAYSHSQTHSPVTAITTVAITGVAIRGDVGMDILTKFRRVKNGQSFWRIPRIG